MKIVKAFAIADTRRIPPFNDMPCDLLVMNRKLSCLQQSVLSEFGIPVKRITREELQEGLSGQNPEQWVLIFRENIFFTRQTIELFLEKTANFLKAIKRKSPSHEQFASDSISAEGSFSKEPGTFRVCVEKSLFTAQLAILQEAEEQGGVLAYDFFLTRAGSFNPDRARKIIMNLDQYLEEGNFPPHMLGKESFRFSVTTRPLMAVSESVHIGLVNMAANFARIASFRRPGLCSGFKALLAAISSLSLQRARIKARVLASLSTIHSTAEVHPTAVIEGSVIGAGAKIGAYAVVRFSVVGKKAFIDDHAGIKFSIIGDNSYVANNNVIFFSTLYPGAFLISGPYQFSCFGYNTAVMNSIPSDYRLDNETIRVMTSSGVRDTGLRFAGSIIGHETRIAAGLIIAPGRSVPGGLTLYPDPARVLTKIDVTSDHERASETFTETYNTEASGKSASRPFFLVDGKLTSNSVRKV
ncbi:MAG: hypothetical protein CVV64_10170 [Candidatus Wallbacteria bacterium HGW-Wallbacteria-1]|jgi:carbonic anhydrase/acetyltransferase-like protein (isoleucine patch superfamily)|uniref:Mannose-1-phosphate guanyltransferase C-terminal domain-containing protein n=1 Tax=Candidatus Wallbacteria bacterium HGW-Wallbacteria-1 TaxID=2013854 RepID=A0A2N1PPR0_9BACT|nr:MAG: hypothetical protein CVV64_10170 [Candidatus Wallbacteria bacterium HGW-Wallbacteria-1]